MRVTITPRLVRECAVADRQVRKALREAAVVLRDVRLSATVPDEMRANACRVLAEVDHALAELVGT